MHLGAAAGGLQTKNASSIGAAASLRIGALGGDPRRAVALVNLLELDEARKGQSDRSKAHIDLALIPVLAEHLGELRTGHAGCDTLDVEQYLPCLRGRKRHIERVVEFHTG